MLESWRWLHSLHSTVQSREVDWTQLDHVIDAVLKNCRSWRALKMPRRMRLPHSRSETGA
jgi:NADH-quinone oxidoreductase subunit G